MRIDKADPKRVVQLASGLANPTGIAQDADAIYFTEWGNGRVYRMRK